MLCTCAAFVTSLLHQVASKNKRERALAEGGGGRRQRQARKRRADVKALKQARAEKKAIEAVSSMNQRVLDPDDVSQHCFTADVNGPQDKSEVRHFC